jgi:hypothetical protein
MSRDRADPVEKSFVELFTSGGVVHESPVHESLLIQSLLHKLLLHVRVQFMSDGGPHELLAPLDGTCMHCLQYVRPPYV